MLYLLISEILRHFGIHVFEDIFQRILNSLFSLHKLAVYLFFIFLAYSLFFGITPQLLLLKEEFHAPQRILLIPFLLLICGAVFCGVIRSCMGTLSVCDCLYQN